MRSTERAKGGPGPKFKFLDRRTLVADDVMERQASLTEVVSTQLLPRLALLHVELPIVGPAVAPRFGANDIAQFAYLVLGADPSVAEHHVSELRAHGLSMEHTFLDLFAPVARRLGQMWDDDECDFVDVTRGMGRLRRLVATTEGDFDAPVALAERSILMSTMPGDQHSFGIAIVEKLLTAAGWRVESGRPGSVNEILDIVEDHEIAVVGLCVSRTNGLERLARAISEIRRHSKNSGIGVMIGGAALCEQPGLGATVGADATAASGSLAVLAAQTLLNTTERRRGRAHR